MKQEHRLILAVALSALIMVVYQSYFAPKPMPPTPGETSATPRPAVPANIVPQAQPVTPQTETAASADATFQPAVKDIVVSTDKLRVTLSTRGGAVTRYELKDYQAVGDDHALKNLLETPDSRALVLALEGYPGFTPESVFDVAREKDLAGFGREITLVWRDQKISVEKIVTIGANASPYLIDVAYRVTSREDAANAGHLNIAPALIHRVRQKPHVENGGFLATMFSSRPDLFHAQYFKDEKLVALPEWQNFSAAKDAGAIPWLALSDRYFMLSAFSGEATTGTEVDTRRDGDFIEAAFRHPAKDLRATGAISGSFQAYLGPKVLHELETLPVPLKKAVDYGWFDFVALPILWLMGFLHRFIPNWGLVIITLTFLVKMVLHPVNKKSMASMKAMQLLQPKMAEIKKRHADNPQKQNEEIMQLFRTHKVNPMGGCLPMLMQMPIYVALYNVLWNAIELYHAPFLWYKDLSAPDPYFIAPVLLGVFMFLQQKLTPSATTDPAQQKMMMIMPVMFSALMLFLPVGLTIYIFVNTLMSVIQQFMMQRDLSFKDLIRGKWQPNGA